MFLRYFPRKLAKFVHPSLRPIVLRRRKRFKVKRTIRQKIVNKVTKYGPLPRVFPFYCEVCTLSSRFLHVIRHHLCSKRNESKHVLAFENELRIITIGSISKSKDAQAVMERISNPQRIDFNIPITDSTRITLEKKAIIPKLAYLCSQIAAEQVDEYKATTRVVFEQLPKRKETKSSPLAYICNVCKSIYDTFREYDDHVRNTDCKDVVPDPIIVAKNMDIVPEYGFGSRVCREFESEEEEYICSACHRDDFRSVSSFHLHIFECAKQLYAPKSNEI